MVRHLHPFAMVVAAAAGLIFSWRDISEDAPAMRWPLVVGLASTVVIGACAALIDMEIIPAGPRIEFWDFGWTNHCALAGWLVTLAAWAAWFGLSIWSLVYGTVAGKKAYLNAGSSASGWAW